MPPQEGDWKPLCKVRVLYIGSGISPNGVSGISAVQSPLAERLPGTLSSVQGIDAWLYAHNQGLQLQYIHDNNVVFFPIEQLYVCAAVKRLDATRFVELDSPEAAGAAGSPPCFALVMKRDNDIRECHGFICKSDQAALALVQSCQYAYQQRGYTKTGGAKPPAPVQQVMQQGPNQVTQPVPVPHAHNPTPHGPHAPKGTEHGYFYTANQGLIRSYNLDGPPEPRAPKPRAIGMTTENVQATPQTLAMPQEMFAPMFQPQAVEQPPPPQHHHSIQSQPPTMVIQSQQPQAMQQPQIIYQQAQPQQQIIQMAQAPAPMQYQSPEPQIQVIHMQADEPLQFPPQPQYAPMHHALPPPPPSRRHHPTGGAPVIIVPAPPPPHRTVTEEWETVSTDSSNADDIQEIVQEVLRRRRGRGGPGSQGSGGGGYFPRGDQESVYRQAGGYGHSSGKGPSFERTFQTDQRGFPTQQMHGGPPQHHMHGAQGQMVGGGSQYGPSSGRYGRQQQQQPMYDNRHPSAQGNGQFMY